MIGLFAVLLVIVTLPGLIGTSAHAAATVAKVDTSALQKSMIAATTNTENATSTGRPKVRRGTGKTTLARGERIEAATFPEPTKRK
jgi:hypothetical protein